MATFMGLTRVRNEAEWISEVLQSLLPLCDFVFVFDDHSTDGTPEICRGLGERVIVHESQFSDVDDIRDKNAIYAELLKLLPPALLNENSPYWVVSIDGDEVLQPDGPELIRQTLKNIEAEGGAPPFSLALRICYLWDDPGQIRVDGIYGDFYRPSVFRVINPAFRFQPTGFPANTHAPCVPQDLVHGFARCPACLKHYGYLRREQRLKKWKAITAADPNNKREDYYRHMIQGDVPSLPAGLKLKWAGPLQLEKNPSA